MSLNELHFYWMLGNVHMFQEALGNMQIYIGYIFHAYQSQPIPAPHERYHEKLVKH